MYIMESKRGVKPVTVPPGGIQLESVTYWQRTGQVLSRHLSGTFLDGGGQLYIETTAAAQFGNHID